LKFLKIENRWVTITYAQHEMYFAYLFLDGCNSGKLNLRLPDLVSARAKIPFFKIPPILKTFFSFDLLGIKSFSHELYWNYAHTQPCLVPWALPCTFDSLHSSPKKLRV
jgi:hypothetical protein